MGKAASQASQPHWIVVRPEVDDESTGGEKYLPMDDGSLLAQGYAPTKHTLELTVKTDRGADHRLSARAAERPEPAAGRSRPVDQGARLP